jgi:hypothetical protein
MTNWVTRALEAVAVRASGVAIGVLVVWACVACGQAGGTSQDGAASATSVAVNDGSNVRIESAGMIDPLRGWVYADGRLYLTADGASSWTDITPPLVLAGSIRAVTFTSPVAGLVAWSARRMRRAKHR